MPGRIPRFDGDAMRTVIDVPPLADDELAVDVAVSAGRAILVTKSGVTDGEAADRLVARLQARGVKIVGAVLTDVPEQSSKKSGSRAGVLARRADGHGRTANTQTEVQHA
jgi:Mrp family chromosome partitioning ATPase